MSRNDRNKIGSIVAFNFIISYDRNGYINLPKCQYNLTNTVFQQWYKDLSELRILYCCVKRPIV